MYKDFVLKIGYGISL